MTTNEKTKTVSAEDLRKRSVLAFAVFVSLFAFAIAGFVFIRNTETINGLSKPLRHVLDFNAAVGERLVGPERIDRAKFPAPARNKPRVNGLVGLSEPIDISKWSLQVVSQSTVQTKSGLTLTLDQIHSLPRTEVTVEFKCIEGWSEVMSFGGVRFTDFMRAHRLGTKSGDEPDWNKRPDDLYRYVGLETPDGEYYVSIDMKSLLNSQTLLAFEQNGAPLSQQNGAPLRLYVPNKYGVKSLKRIGKITFTDQRPADYWEEDGYDWFIGL